MVQKSSIPLYWRLQKSRYRLVGSRCKTCNKVYYPSRNLCPACRRRGNMEEFQFSGNGEIVSYTVIRIPPKGFERYSPYAVAIIRLEEGANISGQIVGDVNNVDTGKRVRPVFRKIYEDGDDGVIHYGIKFEIVS